MSGSLASDAVLIRLQTPAHVYYANYTYAQLRQVLTMMTECCENPQQHHSIVYNKYADRRYQRAALYCEGEMRKGFRVPESCASIFDSRQPWRHDARK